MAPAPPGGLTLSPPDDAKLAAAASRASVLCRHDEAALVHQQHQRGGRSLALIYVARNQRIGWRDFSLGASKPLQGKATEKFNKGGARKKWSVD